MIDWTKVLESFIGNLPVLIPAVGAFILSIRNSGKANARDVKIEQLHQATDGMKDALVAATKSEALKEGHASGMADAYAKQDVQAAAHASGVADEKSRQRDVRP